MDFPAQPEEIGDLRTVLETALDAVVVMRQDGIVAGWNDRAKSTFGWSREEALGARMSALIIPARYREAHERGLARFLEQGEGPVLRRRIEIEALHRNGEEFPVELSIAPYATGSGILFVGFLRDITKRREAEDALRESESRLNAILESLSDGFCALDHEWRIRFFNHSAEKALGVTRNEVLGKVFWDVFPESENSIFKQQYHRVMDGRQTVEFEAESRRMNGKLVAVRAAPTPDGGIAIAFSDITERRATERKLVERGIYLDALFEQTAAGIAQCDTEGQFLLVNTRYCELVGRNREELLKMRMQDITHPEDLRQNMPLFRRCVETGEPFEIEKRYICPDGSIVWVSNSVSRVRLREGLPGSVLAVAVDITERKRFEEHQRLLINELNHRVKNSLAVVQAIAQQSFKGADIPHEVKSAFEGRLTALSAAHNVLTRQNWEPAPISQMIENAIEPYRTAQGRFVIEGPEVKLSPRAAVNLALAVHELGTNAAKYGALSNSTGSVHIGWTVTGDMLHFKWQEQGGPAVSSPQRRGFGTRMIERGLAAEFGGRVEIDFRPDGLVCTIEAALPNLDAEDHVS